MDNEILERLREVVTEEWRTSHAIAYELGEPLLKVLPALRGLVAEGEIEGQRGRWRRIGTLPRNNIH